MKYGKEHREDSYFHISDLRKEFTKNGKVTAMDGELELFQEIVDKVMSDPINAEIDPAEVVKKSLSQIAGKLLAEGLNPVNFTVPKAIGATRDVAAPAYVRRLIETFPEQIVKEMKKMTINNKFGL